MIEAALWGLVGGISLIAGAAVGLAWAAPQRVIGLVMAFGSGVLIAALSFELTEESFRQGGITVVAVGLGAGALSFFTCDWLLDRKGGAERKRSGGEQKGGSSSAIVLGAVMDGVPESVVIGLSMAGGATVSGTVVAAVAISNIAESLSASTGLRKAGVSSAHVLEMWTAVALVSAASAALGYAFLADLSADVVGLILAFAAGAILTMLADTMMPEAFEHGGSSVGLLTVLGFVVAFALATA